MGDKPAFTSQSCERGLPLLLLTMWMIRSYFAHNSCIRCIGWRFGDCVSAVRPCPCSLSLRVTAWIRASCYETDRVAVVLLRHLFHAETLSEKIAVLLSTLCFLHSLVSKTFR